MQIEITKNTKNKQSKKRNGKAKASRPKVRRVARPYGFGLVSKNSHRMTLNGNNMVVSGRELVGTVTAVDDYDMANIVSCNPVSHSGTRLSAIAAAYSTYAIKRLALHFEPTKSTATSGVVVIGTNFDDGSFDPTSTPALASTNGGTVSNVYLKNICRPDLNGLRQPKFNMDLERGDSEPFRFSLKCDGVTAGSCGLIYLEYEYHLYNASPSSSYITVSAPASVTVDGAAAVGDNVVLDVGVVEDTPVSVTFMEELTSAVRAGVKYALEETATAGKYYLSLFGKRILADAVFSTATIGAALYNRHAGVLGFR